MQSITENFKNPKWTEAETRKLVELVRSGMPWPEVYQVFPKRSKDGVRSKFSKNKNKYPDLVRIEPVLEQAPEPEFEWTEELESVAFELYIEGKTLESVPQDELEKKMAEKHAWWAKDMSMPNITLVQIKAGIGIKKITGKSAEDIAELNRLEGILFGG